MSTEKKTFPRKSIESQLIEKYMREDGRDSVTEAELANVIGESVKSGTRGYQRVQTAIATILADDSVLWVKVDGGWKKSGNQDVVDAVKSEVRRIHSASIRGMKKAAAIDTAKASNTELVEFNTQYSILAAFRAATNASGVKRIEKAVEQSKDKLPVAKTIQAILASENGSK